MAAAGAAMGQFLERRMSAATPPRQSLLIILAVEQLRADYLTLYSNRFRNAGFKRLMEEGVYYTGCQTGSAAFSASGLGTIATGTIPASHGVVAERWFDTNSNQAVTASGGSLLAGTMAEEVTAADPRNRIFAIGLNESHAGLITGRAPGFHFGLDDQARWTSTRGTAPGWFSGFQNANAAERYRNARWGGMNARPGAPPMRTLTYDANRPGEFAALLRASPFSQYMQFELLRELIQRESLGRGPGLDCVFVSLDALGALSYQTGARSPLVTDMLANLDRQIGGLLAFLQNRTGSANYQVVLTGCHGAPPLPDPSKAIAGDEIARAIDAALEARFSERRLVRAYLYPFVYLDSDRLHKAKGNRREARELAAQAAVATGKVNAYYTADGDCSHAGEWQRRLSNSFHSTRSGDLILSYPPGFVEDYGEGRGISYGSIYNYDVRVPLIFYGPQLRADVVDTPVELADIAPTLARSLGIAEPSSSTGRVLSEALPSAAAKERK